MLGAGFIAVGAIAALLALAYWGACKIAGPRPPYLADDGYWGENE